MMLSGERERKKINEYEYMNIFRGPGSEAAQYHFSNILLTTISADVRGVQGGRGGEGGG